MRLLAASVEPTSQAPARPIARPAVAGRLDPRLYQIATLAGLLVYGIGWLGFDIAPPMAALILITALGTQLVATRLSGHGGFDPRSALISGLSLCLLLRTSSPPLAILAAVIAVGSKF